MPTATESPAPAEQFDDLAQQQRADLIGMWLFLATELLLFGALFTAFAVFRIEFPRVFAEAAHHLDLVLGTINTAVLMTSGLTVALAEQAVTQRRKAPALKLLSATIALGFVFLAIKGYEWHHEYQEGLMPVLGLTFTYPGADPAVASLFFDFYFAMTGLHAAHMFIGIVLLTVMGIIVLRRGATTDTARQVRIAGLYWAFVDVVWVFMFTTLYLLRA